MAKTAKQRIAEERKRNPQRIAKDEAMAKSLREKRAKPQLPPKPVKEKPVEKSIPIKLQLADDIIAGKRKRKR